MNALGVDEKSASFSQRLTQELLRHRKSLSPTTLAREFNLRWRGSPVTANAVRKWIFGGSIPTLDKIDVLANMLGTSREWLRWGTVNTFTQSHTLQQIKHGDDPSIPRNFEKAIIQDYRLLNKSNQRVIFNLMELMLQEQKQETSSI
jgi:hypothetical protein